MLVADRQEAQPTRRRGRSSATTRTYANLTNNTAIAAPSTARTSAAGAAKIRTPITCRQYHESDEGGATRDADAEPLPPVPRAAARPRGKLRREAQRHPPRHEDERQRRRQQDRRQQDSWQVVAIAQEVAGAPPSPRDPAGPTRSRPARRPPPFPQKTNRRATRPGRTARATRPSRLSRRPCRRAGRSYAGARSRDRRRGSRREPALMWHR